MRSTCPNRGEVDPKSWTVGSERVWPILESKIPGGAATAKQRKVRESEYKACVAFDALQERETVGQLAKCRGVHPTQVQEWKRRLLEQAPLVFDRSQGAKKAEDFETAELDEQIGRLKMELDSVKKSETSL